MSHRLASMIVGLILALGMAGLLLVWLAMNEGSGIVGLLFIFGVAAGVVVVLAGALTTNPRTERGKSLAESDSVHEQRPKEPTR